VPILSTNYQQLKNYGWLLPALDVMGIAEEVSTSYGLWASRISFVFVIREQDSTAH
jgi:hypothetical protein